MTGQVRPQRLRRWVLALAPLVAVALVPAPAGSDEEPVPGMAGVDTSLPKTESAVTVSGRGSFSGLRLTVNQTSELTNQAISVTWQGGNPTVAQGAKLFSAHFLQFMQCWGEPDAEVPENPGPPPEKCVWGALNPTAASELPGFATNLVTSRAFWHRDFPGEAPNVGTYDGSGELFRDFVAVDGTVVTDHIDHTASGEFDQYWQNPYFDSIKSNEVPGVRTLGDGTGQLLFTVNTGLESNGLGCGQRVEPSTGGERKVPRCWLVIVPRGLPEVENAGTPFDPNIGVATSPMSPENWRNRVAVELDFTPIDSPCDISGQQRRISGNELPTKALSSWQPVLCTQPGLLPFAYGTVSDQLARRQVLDDSESAPGMVAVNRPLPEGGSGEDDPVLYAPLTISAATIAFNVERIRSLDTPDDRLQRVRFATMNLTPRLVAKLLTQSYRGQVEIRGSEPFYEDEETGEPIPYTWHVENPLHMLADPDFLRFNPEFRLWQSGSGKHAGGLILPAGTSDLATQVWDWILADPEASAWLEGAPDEFGMKVNPIYSTDAGKNPSGIAFAEVAPDSFPKADPYCFQEAKLASGVTPGELCAIDWFPYVDSLAVTARNTARAADESKTVLDRTAGLVTEAWRRSSPQGDGRRTMLGLTDTPSANQYGLQTARLSRAGDNGADREFVVPDANGLARSVASMTEEGHVLQVDPTGLGRGAYPLTTVTYAAIRPLALDDEEREDFAAFLDYAAGPGQVPGLDLGQLPPGFLPLPPALAETTGSVADQVRTLQRSDEPSPTTSTTVETGSSSETPSGSDFGGSGASRSGLFGTGSDGPGVAAGNPPPDDGTDGVEIAAPSAAEGDRLTTPFEALGSGRFVLAMIAGLAVLSALGSLEIRNGIARRLITRARPS